MTQVHGRYRTRTYGLFRVKVRTLEKSQAIGTSRLTPRYQNRLKSDTTALFDQITLARSPKSDQTERERRATRSASAAVVAAKETS